MAWVEQLPYLLNGKHNSLLISGGLDSKLRVPVAKFTDEFLRLKKAGYRLNFHTGIINEDDNLEFLKFADAVSIDFIGDDEVIKEVYGAKATVNDYLRSIEVARKYLEPSVHLTIGIQCGKISHEFKSLEILKELELKKLILNVFIPTAGTAYQNCFPPEFDDIRLIFQKARLYFPKLILGCMQPKGAYRKVLQRLAIDNEFDVIVKPVPDTYHYVEKKGNDSLYYQECCAFI